MKVAVKLTWSPLVREGLSADEVKRLCYRLNSVLQAWKGTPYREGDMCRGAGVDCLRFGLAIMDEMYGTPTRAIPRVAQDASLHDEAQVRAAVREMVRVYGPLVEVAEGAPVMPGDLVVTGPEGGGPGHLMVVGPDPNELWHSTRGIGVVMTGVYVPGLVLMHVFRVQPIREWLR